MAKKKQMEQANPGRNVEQPLWHGTSWQVVGNINAKGFDRNYNSGRYYFVSSLPSKIVGKIFCHARDSWNKKQF